MKKLPLIIFGTASLALASLNAQNLVSNGGFETVTGSTPYTFAELADWSNLGTGAATTGAAQVATPSMTGVNLGLVDNTYNRDGSSFGFRAHVQDTGYVIASGDSFNVSYDWRPSSANGSWGPSDELRFILYATSDNTALGTQVWIEIFDSGTQTTLNTEYSVSDTSEIVTSGAVGQNLFVNFYGLRKTGSVPTTGGTAGYAGIDEISVSVVPEPSAGALLFGFASLLLITRRRR